MLPSLPIPMIGALILGFLCASMVLTQRRISAFAALVALCAAQSAVIALVLHYQIGAFRPLQPVLASLIPPLAWIALTNSGREQGARLWPHLAAPLVAVAALAVQPFALDVLIPLLFIGYGAAIVRAGLRGADALPRLRFESGEASGLIWRWIGLALIASGLSDVAIIAAMISGRADLMPLIVGGSASAALLAMGVLSLSRTLTDMPEPEAEPAAAVSGLAPNLPVDAPPSEQDAAIVARLDAVMEQAQLYRDPDLTLSRLAKRLGLPVKTLSGAINKVTGENVSRYINARRIEAACRALDAGKSVTDAMLDAGFHTKSNFNREFLRLTGQTPREYRS